MSEKKTIEKRQCDSLVKLTHSYKKEKVMGFMKYPTGS